MKIRGLFRFSMHPFSIFVRMSVKSIFILVFVSVVVTSCNNAGNGNSESAEQSGGSQVKSVKTDSLLAAINKRIAENPKDYKSYLERARYYGDRMEYPLAFQDISRAMEVDSTKGEIYLFKGGLLFKQNKITEAYSEYQTCLRHEATNSDCLLRKAEIDIVLGNYSYARDHINEALKQNEYNAEAYYVRGRMYKAMKDTTLAASSYKTAIEVDPNYYYAYIEVGLLYANQKSDLAKEYYNSAIELRPRSVEAWYNKAMFLQETGVKKPLRYREAFACYDTILKIDGRYSPAYFNKGYIYLEYMQKYDSAATQFTNAIGIFPNYYQAYYNRGLSNESLSKLREAESDYRAALAIEPTYTEAAIALERVLKSK